MSLFGGEKKVRQHIDDLTSGKKTMAQINEPLSPFEKDLLSGLCRHWICLNHTLDQYLQKQTQQRDFRLILVIGIYRLLLTTQPNNKPIIDGLMLLAEKWGLGFRKKVIYAILNNVLRNPPDFQSFPENIRYSLPPFFYKKMKASLGSHFDLSAHNQIQRPSIWALVFDKAHITHEMTVPYPDQYPRAIQFDSLKNLTEKTGYQEGHWQIQDLAMQKMAAFLPTAVNGALIDACASPGGKTIVLNKRFPENPIFAIEIEPKKIQRLKDNLLRCHGDNVNVVCTNFLQFNPKAKPGLIWLDAPCSGSGVIGKHPEIKYQISKEQLLAHQQQQIELLNHAWEQVKPGGTVFYSTCSIFPEENDDVIESFNEYIVDITPPSKAIRSQYGLTFLMDNQFGGYLSILKKPETWR
ncbi:hypothetical protein N9C31_00040 [Gammaproteobacteria bacterium]|nr:hypothetical protein [Gammaproteobacteria bacterium]